MKSIQFRGDHSVFDMTKTWGADFVRQSVFTPEGDLWLISPDGKETQVGDREYVFRDEEGRFLASRFPNA